MSILNTEYSELTVTDRMATMIIFENPNLYLRQVTRKFMTSQMRGFHQQVSHNHRKVNCYSGCNYTYIQL